MMRPIAVAGIAVAAVAAAGVGAYLGVRHAIGPASGIASTVAADPALAAGEPSPAPVTAPEPEPAETEVVVEPVAADPPPAPRPVARREPPAPRPAAAPPEPARRTPPAAARPVAPEPSLRPQPVPAPVATLPEPEPAPAPVPAPRRPAGDRARAATADPPLPPAGLPVVEGWARAGGPAGAAPPRRPEPERPPLASTSFLDARAARPAVAPSPWPSFDEIEIAADSVIGIQIETAVSTRTARLEDPVEARVTRDVQVGARVAIPSGTRMRGSVVLVESGGRLRSASRLGVRFHALVMDDGAEVTLSTETIYREGKPPGGDSVAKIGGAAVAGSILGAIFGGERGAAIGGSIGAAGGTAAALNGEAEPASLPPGSRLTVRLSLPARVTVPR